MRRSISPSAILVAGLGLAGSYGSGCSNSAPDVGSIRTGSASASLVPAPTNFRISSSTAGATRHELSTTFVSGAWQGAASPPPGTLEHGRWINVWYAGDHPTALAVGWAPSNDGRGDLWTPHEMQVISDFGTPAGGAPHNNYTFNGWRGDPAIANVTNPEFNNMDGGQRAIIVEIAQTAQGADIRRDEVVAAITSDGGDTFGHAAYVTTGPFGSPPSMIDSGGFADIPHIATNQVAPFNTWVTWETNPGLPNGATWLRRIQYDRNFNFSGNDPIVVPLAGGTFRRRPNVAVGTWTSVAACTSGGEAVFVVSAGFQDRCEGNNYVAGPMKWWLSGFDPANNNSWYGPWLLYDETVGVPNCVGSAGQTDNSTDPHIAVDTSTTTVWTTHTIGAACGSTGCPPGVMNPRTSEVRVEGITFFCNSGPTPCPNGGRCPQININPWSPPGGGGSSTISAWVPGIAVTHVPTTDPVPPAFQRTAVYWMSTRGDTQNVNASVFMSFLDNYGGLSNPMVIAVATPMTSEVVPWDNTLAKYDDYQHLAGNNTFGSFLAAWPDRRVATDPQHLWSDLLMP